MKSRSQKSSVLSSVGKNKRKPHSATPQNFDQLALSVQELLNDERLEVSKVRPFFWSLVEAYIDKFQVYPFDVSKALLSYLELQACPQEEVQALIDKLERLYEKKELEVTVKKTPLKTQSVVATTAVKSSSSDIRVAECLPASCPGLDDDVMALRACLKYASLVSDI